MLGKRFAATKNILAEVIVIDNASTDKSVDMIRKQFPSARVITNVDNLASERQTTKLQNWLKEYIYVFLNPDTIVSENTFEQFITLHESKPNLGISGPQLIDGTGQFTRIKRGIPTIKAATFKFLGLFKLSPVYLVITTIYAFHKVKVERLMLW